MREAIVGVTIFLGLQIAFFLVLFGVTLWEGHQLRPVPQRLPASRPARSGDRLPQIPPEET